MRVMVLVRATQDSESGTPPTPELMAAMGAFNDRLHEAGILQDLGGLRPSSLGARVHFDGDGRRVDPGPFTPAGDLVAGFWIWNVRDLDEAIAWVRQCPNPMPGPSDIEIRPFQTLEDFA